MSFLRRYPFLTAALVVALIATGVFATRLYHSAHRWPGPLPPAPPIDPWMTPRHVAEIWRVPPEVVGEALGLTKDGTGKRMSLADLAEARGIPEAELAAQLTAALTTWREAHK